MDWQTNGGRVTGQRLHGGLVSLLVVIAFATILWAVVLPAWVQTPTWQHRLQHLDHQGVDPGAFFYTDHPRLFEKDQGDLQ